MRLLLNLGSLLFLLIVLAAAGGLLLISWYGRDLPDTTRLADYEPPVTTRLYAGDGRLLAEYAAERRFFVPIEAIPAQVKNAFLSAEDKDFYRHGGVDFMGIARALLSDVRNLGHDRRPKGASTITQQVAKNFFLTNEVSIGRKIREAILATRIEQALTKDRILELYLNEIFLGQKSYGVAAAALTYFDKPLDQLTLSEAAFLAALPKAPNNYNPERHYAAALERRNWVIDRMVENGMVSAQDGDAAKREPILLHTRPDAETASAPYFAEEVRRWLEAKYGADAVLEGGLTVRTTVDPDLQRMATKALRDGLVAYDHRHGWRGPIAKFADFNDWARQLAKIPVPAGAEDWRLAVTLAPKDGGAEIGFANGTYGFVANTDLAWLKNQLVVGDVILTSPKDEPEAKPNAKQSTAAKLPHYEIEQIPAVEGAIVVMDPHTGRVLAMTGGFSAEMSVFNRATQAERQPGSSFKPFVYLAALDRGLTPSTLVMDAPISLDQGPGLPKWEPANYGGKFYGPTPMRVGIEKSRNVMTVRIAQYIGMPIITDYAKKFGIEDNMPQMLSMALGSIETTPLRLTTAYAMLDNGGKKITPSLVDQIQDREGRTLWRQDDRACDNCQTAGWKPDLAVPALPDTRAQINDPRTTYQIVSMLEGVTERGTAAKLASLGKPLAGKTGTTNDSHDTWFIGFTPDLVAGVYVGFDQPQSLGHETGASVAVPIFKEFMEQALKNTPGIPFRVPPGLRLVRVDPATGKLAAPGQKAIWDAFLPGTEPGQNPNLNTILGADANGNVIDVQPLPPMAGTATPPATAAAAAQAINTGSASPPPAQMPTPDAPPGPAQPQPAITLTPPPAPSEQSAPGNSATTGTGGLY